MDKKKFIVKQIQQQVSSGKTSASSITDRSINRALAEERTNAHAYTIIYEEFASLAAQAMDRNGNARSASALLAGVPVSIKDLFDKRGEVTMAGSRARRGATPASANSIAVSRMLAAGAVIIGKTNMSEFACESLGQNGFHGMPVNPAAPACVPGGSSSGAAVSVANGSVPVALATDTGGSIRIPAALCGVTGFKPSTSRVSSNGVFPLSRTFDTVGPIAKTVDCCARIDTVIKGEQFTPLLEIDLSGLRLGIPGHLVMEDLDDTVAAAFSRSVSVLARAGASIVEFDWPELYLPIWQSPYAKIVWYEAFDVHKEMLKRRWDHYQIETRAVISQGRGITSSQYETAIEKRHQLIKLGHKRTQDFDAVIMPTSPTVATARALVESSYKDGQTDQILDRNAEVANFFAYCACTLPCHLPDELPVGFQLMGADGNDRRILSIAAKVEECLSRIG